ncbi:UDP-N-acetylmuramoyl-tripeptide--D-alanyl-D-alanine ligase [Bartonella sp. HY329]|uniref:UDP-N-acetylmuramoyl-tripeptide--D-alanyl-D- alanine ligase n=1 Tax=unclassified Bartonella TaxID=2645622 RepID=UPI0021C6BD5D|nr:MULTISPECIES: UDP-N-acetylmuramoyl-tripeptide--D-alanyl-D-alanine ligase [unclassified Bartonella]UXM95879.1 UDP-N-acetylmuramoyl-tripeptide--D-alanyl-D-alanine ligase [Bartonella sp. HY329]UXN10204.1 UDP-N-acetylmuramoyl-tripeptide--D-alanyl-D-alanine ligase [Bartonella sp. HY328]
MSLQSSQESNAAQELNAPLWSKEAFYEAIGGSVFGEFSNDIFGISIDSRSLQKGDAFFAIAGDKFDGHDFAKGAFENGAAILVVDEPHSQDMQSLAKEFQKPILIVDDVLKALERLGEAARLRSKAKIIAITGSVGKTTTKEALRHVLSGFGNVHANPASFNNHWGVPLTLARMPQNIDFGIFEIGMNHENEIRPLVKLVKPHIALITRIGAAHMGYFSSLEAIADAKAEIFEGIIHGGNALINIDDDLGAYLVDKARQSDVGSILSFGESEKADYQLRSLVLNAQNSDITIKTPQANLSLTIGVPGRHIVQNMLAVIAVCDLLKLDLIKVGQLLGSLQAESGRGARHLLKNANGGLITLIDESYNANPTSMRAALLLLKNCQPKDHGRRIAVLGDMLELGRFSKQSHEDLIAPITDAKVDVIFLVGSEMKALADKFGSDNYTKVSGAHLEKIIWQETIEQLQPLVLAELQSDDVIMIKSSNGIGSAKIVRALLSHN